MMLILTKIGYQNPAPYRKDSPAAQRIQDRVRGYTAVVEVTLPIKPRCAGPLAEQQYPKYSDWHFAPENVNA